MSATPLVSVTDHAVDRYRQRVRGTLDPRAEIASRVARAWAEGRAEPGRGGAFDVRDGPLLFVCHHDRPRRELVVVTVWDTAQERFRAEGRRMGFLDKAKQMAEQAQQKIEEAQTQFNERQGAGTASGQPAPEYDQHGRPVPSAPPSDEAAPHGDPLAGGAPHEASPATTADTPTESTETKPHGDPLAAAASHAPSPPSEPAPPAEAGSQGEPEDRNREDYSPPSLSSGDPLAG